MDAAGAWPLALGLGSPAALSLAMATQSLSRCPAASSSLSPVCAFQNSMIGLERADLLSPVH